MPMLDDFSRLENIKCYEPFFKGQNYVSNFVVSTPKEKFSL